MHTRLEQLPQPMRWALVAVAAAAILLLLWLQAMPGPAPDAGAAAVSGEGDLVSYQRIVERMKAGADYYDAAHEVLVADGYGTRSVFNWRTPAWPILLSTLPLAVVQGLVGALAVTGLALTYWVLRRDAGVAVAALGLVAVGGSLGAIVSPASLYFSEVPAGTLILLSVMAYANGWRWAGLVAALAALFLRELAAPYVVIAAILALRERRWSEVAGWTAGAIAYAAYFGWHWWQVTQQLGPTDRADPESWLQFGGIAFVLKTVGFNGLWSLGPEWLAAIFLPLGLLGLWAWRGGTLALAAVVAYAVLFAAVGKPFNSYWGAVYTPLLMLGVGWGIGALAGLRPRLTESPQP